MSTIVQDGLFPEEIFPLEIWWKIGNYLSYQEIINMQLLCQDMLQIMNENHHIWREMHGCVKVLMNEYHKFSDIYGRSLEIGKIFFKNNTNAKPWPKNCKEKITAVLQENFDRANIVIENDGGKAVVPTTSSLPSEHFLLSLEDRVERIWKNRVMKIFWNDRFDTDYKSYLNRIYFTKGISADLFFDLVQFENKKRFPNYASALENSQLNECALTRNNLNKVWMVYVSTVEHHLNLF